MDDDGAPAGAGRHQAMDRRESAGPDASAEYTGLVLDLVAQIPPGCASTYGDIADAARVLTGRGSARTVGQIMSRHGAQVPWWRVVPATGIVPEHLRARAAVPLRAEATPMRSTDPLRVDLRRASWLPPL